jgi:hypothetical protein
MTHLVIKNSKMLGQSQISMARNGAHSFRSVVFHTQDELVVFKLSSLLRVFDLLFCLPPGVADSFPFNLSQEKCLLG